jgi:hypothetical protein
MTGVPTGKQQPADNFRVPEVRLDKGDSIGLARRSGLEGFQLA